MKRHLTIIVVSILVLLLALTAVIVRDIIILTQKPILLGDVNMDGMIDQTDIDMVHQHLLLLTELDEGQKFRADMDQDGEITVIDLFRIHKIHKYIGGK